MRNKFYFQINVKQEQIDYTNKLVDYSLKHHKISNIWDKDPNQKAKTRVLRFTGTLGEVLFADTYKLERPKKSFGAYDGQDLGKDFNLIVGNKIKNFDIKTMHRKTNIFYGNYVLNIPSSQLHKTGSLTDYYFCISLHKNRNRLIASFLGYISKEEIKKSKIGILYKTGALRTRADGTKFKFYDDTYEIDFKDITSPMINESIKKMKGFKILKLKK